MAGYSKTPLSKKLGLHPQDRVVLRDAPTAWGIPAPPDGVSFLIETAKHDHSAPAEVVLAFFRTHAQLCDGVPVLAPRIFPDGAIWVAWPRRAAGHESDIREQNIRDLALPLGLVDVKVAALDEDWSGLRLVWRRELRDTSEATPG